MGDSFGGNDSASAAIPNPVFPDYREQRRGNFSENLWEKLASRLLKPIYRSLDGAKDGWAGLLTESCRGRGLRKPSALRNAHVHDRWRVREAIQRLDVAVFVTRSKVRILQGKDSYPRGCRRRGYASPESVTVDSFPFQ